MNAIITQNHARYGYGYVNEKGFVAFSHDVSEGPWADVDVGAYDNDERSLGEDVLDVPRPVAWKLRAMWSIATVRDALGGEPGGARGARRRVGLDANGAPPSCRRTAGETPAPTAKTSLRIPALDVTGTRCGCRS